MRLNGTRRDKKDVADKKQRCNSVRLEAEKNEKVGMRLRICQGIESFMKALCFLEFRSQNRAATTTTTTTIPTTSRKRRFNYVNVRS